MENPSTLEQTIKFLTPTPLISNQVPVSQFPFHDFLTLTLLGGHTFPAALTVFGLKFNFSSLF